MACAAIGVRLWVGAGWLAAGWLAVGWRARDWLEGGVPSGARASDVPRCRPLPLRVVRRSPWAGAVDATAAGAASRDASWTPGAGGVGTIGVMLVATTCGKWPKWTAAAFCAAVR